MISYAGIPLLHDTEALRMWIAANADPMWAQDAAPPDLRTRTLWLSGPRRPAQDARVELNVLKYPWGASRFAVGHFLASYRQLALIRPQVYSGANGYQACPLVMSDGTNTLTTPLWMLPPRPLTGIPGVSGQAWLLTLVDSRWFWPYVANAYTVVGGSTTWAYLLGVIEGVLGETITWDTIPSAYVYPDPILSSYYDSWPQTFDAVCASIGMRLVRNLDGTFRVSSTATAKATVASNLANRYPVRSGGALALTLAVPSDLNAAVPASITVGFPEGGPSGGGSSPPNLYTVTITLASLALTDFGSATGFAQGDRVLYSTELAYYASGSLANATEIQNLATQIATDWYEWIPGTLDLTLIGSVPWNPEGQHDIEWRHHDGAIVTRIRKGPWREDVQELYHWGTYGSGSFGGSGGGIGPTGGTVSGGTVNYINSTVNNNDTTVNNNSTTVTNYAGSTTNYTSSSTINTSSSQTLTYAGAGTILYSSSLLLVQYNTPTYFNSTQTLTYQQLTYSTTQNNVTLTANVLILVPGASNIGITGFVAPPTGQSFILWILNNTTTPTTIYNANTGSSAANRCVCPGGADYILQSKAAISAAYDPVLGIWEVGDGTIPSSTSVGQIPIGNSSGGYSPATLTAGSNITITNSSGAVTIAASGGGGNPGQYNGTVQMTTVYGCTSSYASTGLTVTLAAGTWIVIVSANTTIASTSIGAQIQMRLYDSTAGAQIGLPFTGALNASATLPTTQTTTSQPFVVILTGTDTLQLQAEYTGTVTGAGSGAQINAATGTANPATQIVYWKIN